MRFVLIALGPMSVGVAYLASTLVRPADDARAGLLIAVLVAGPRIRGRPRGRRGPARAGGRARPRVVREFLTRREPTYRVGRWVGEPPAGGGPADRPGPSRASTSRATTRWSWPIAAGPAWAGTGSRPARSSTTLKQDGFTHVMLCPPVPGDGRRVRPDARAAARALAGGPRAALPRGPDRRRRRRAAVRDLRAPRSDALGSPRAARVSTR